MTLLVTENKYRLYRICFDRRNESIPNQKGLMTNQVTNNFWCFISNDVNYLTEDIDTWIRGPSSIRTHDEPFQNFVSK